MPTDPLSPELKVCTIPDGERVISLRSDGSYLVDTPAGSRERRWPDWTTYSTETPEHPLSPLDPWEAFEHALEFEGADAWWRTYRAALAAERQQSTAQQEALKASHEAWEQRQVALLLDRDRALQKAEADVASLTATVRALQQRQQWQPIETAPKDGTTILRPHRIYGAMDVCYITDNQRPVLHVLSDGIDWRWVNGDKTTAWTDDAFQPFWMPVPLPPSALQEPHAD